MRFKCGLSGAFSAKVLARGLQQALLVEVQLEWLVKEQVQVQVQVQG